MPGIYSGGLPMITPAVPGPGIYPQLTGYETVPADTAVAPGNLMGTGGAFPQAIAATTFDLASLAAGLVLNTTAAVTGAATLSTLLGTVTSEALVTAAGATYTLTLTNTAVTATSVMQAQVVSGTNRTPGAMVQSIAPAAGSAVIVVRNNNPTTALNGTLQISFIVRPAGPN